MKYIAPFGFYFLYFAAFATLLPYFVLFYQSLGFTGAQIGLLTGVPPLITLFGAPFGTGFADRTRRHKLVLGSGLVVGITTMLVLPKISEYLPIFALVMLFNLFMAPVASLSDSATMAMLGDQRGLYGRIRVGGTIGWGIFAQIAGLLFAWYGLETLFYVFSGIMLVNLIVSQNLSFGESDVRDSHKSNNDVRTLLKNRHWIIFLVSAFLGGVGSFSVASYLSPFLRELGASGGEIGFAFLIATFTELPAFYFANLLIKQYSSYRLFMISLVLLGVRSLLFGVVGNLYLAIAIQGIGGVIFPAMWSAAVAYADENAPAGLKSTAQGLFGSMTFGFGAAVTGFVGGLLLERVGGRGMFLAFGIIILAGLVLIEVAKRVIPDREFIRPEI